MQTIDTNMVLLAAFGLFVIYLLAAMLAADGWVLYRLLTGQRVFPAAPLVARRPVPWGAWTILVLVAMTILLPVCVYLGYAKAIGVLPRRSLVRSPAANRRASEAPLCRGNAGENNIGNGRRKPRLLPSKPWNDTCAVAQDSESPHDRRPGRACSRPGRFVHLPAGALGATAGRRRLGGACGRHTRAARTRENRGPLEPRPRRSGSASRAVGKARPDHARRP